MALTKRKRTTTHTKPNKRQKQKPVDDTLWSAKDILDERLTEDGQLEYLIDWEGIDPRTRKPYRPDWQPAENATAELVEDWEKQKAEAARSKRAASKSSGRGTRGERNQPQLPLQPPPRPAKKPRIVESSPEPSTRSSTVASERSTPAPSALSQSSVYTSPVGPARPSPQVHIRPRSSFDPDEFDRHSQLPLASQSIESTRRSLHTSSQSSYNGPRNYRSSGIVEDSEGEGEDSGASYIPTQHASASSLTQQQSSSANEELSALTPFEALGHPLSPAISIPETEPEVEHDRIEYSQAQLPSQAEIDQQQEIPDTCETVVSTSQPAALEVQEHSQHPVAEDSFQAVGIPEEQDRTVSTIGEQTLNCPAGASQPIAQSGSEAQSSLSGNPEIFRPTKIVFSRQSSIVEQTQHPEPLDSRIDQVGSSPPSADDSVSAGKHVTLINAKNTHHRNEQQALQQDTTFHTTINIPQPLDQREAAVVPDVTLPVPSGLVADPLQPASQPSIPSSGHNSEAHQGHLRLRSTLPEPAGTYRSRQRNTTLPFDPVAQASQLLQGVIDGSVERRDFALPSQTCSGSSGLSVASRTGLSEQQAQVVPQDLYTSTQDDYSNSIRPTIEKDETVEHPDSPQSRHDSSQQSPEVSSATVNSSSPPPPPNQSLGILHSNPPPRPRTPYSSPLSIKMDAKNIQAKLDEAFAQAQRDNPFVPKRKWKSSRPRDAGTRSPSTIPNHAPTPQVPTSLRTVAMSNSAAAAPLPEPALARREVGSGVSIPEIPVSTEDELSDADNESLLNDDLELQAQEYIVPLSIDGRQASMYKDEIRNQREVLKAFLDKPQSFDQIEKIQKVLEHLRGIETHVDLVLSESSLSQDVGSSTQVQHQAQWTSDNSIKFRFIGALFDKLRDRDVHVVLVVEKDNEGLFNITESFLRGKFVNFKSPATGRQADLAHVEGRLTVTVLSSNSSPIVRPPDLVVCLDGCLEATHIRKKNWASNPDRATVPIIHLVIPRTVGHVERYVSSSLNTRRRLHTIVATLAQLQHQGEIGRPMYSHTPKTNEAADEIVAFLLPNEEDGPPQAEWPLPSIGSIKDLIDFQSQQSQETITTPPPGTQVGSTKRPLEHEALDPAKRVRLTPQPQPTSENNNEVTHISDSMPSTAVEVSKLQEQLAEKDRALEKERAFRKATVKHLRENEASWEKQQTVHEDLARSYNVLKKEKETIERQLDFSTKRETSLREKLDVKATEHRDLQARFKELQDTQICSDDEKVAEIARLRKELADAKEAEQRAVRNKDTAESTLEYTKEQYRKAQDVAVEERREKEDIAAERDVYKRKASGEAAALAKLHYDRQDKLAAQQDDQHVIQLRILKQQNQAKDDEIARLRSSRGIGVGTRAQSVGPKTPRPGSRAASPLPGNRDRLANLRNG